MEKLTTKQYWNNVHNTNFIRYSDMFQGLQNYEFYKTFEKSSKVSHLKTVLEVGCSPANYLVNLNKKFELEPYGMDYSDTGVIKSKQNFKLNNLNPENIIEADLFDKDFITHHESKYDIVYSIGFIEHFDDPSEAIANHFKLVKYEGLVIITIPNKRYINSLFSSKKNLGMHNLSIMSIPKLKELFKDYDVLDIKYSGGLFNIGQFHYDNWLLEKIRFMFFLGQRLTLDPLFILLNRLGINLSNKYSSPQIIVVAMRRR
jgi:2-polyprenyl-3-methyl-5-hydroxy-6-metoxy-1,4-benzoquinol methylase